MQNLPEQSNFKSSHRLDTKNGNTFHFFNGIHLCESMPFSVDNSSLNKVIFEKIEFYEKAPGTFEPIISTTGNATIFKQCIFRHFSRPIARIPSRSEKTKIIIFKDCHFENHVFPLIEPNGTESVKTVFQNCTFTHCFHDIQRNEAVDTTSL